MDQKNRIIASSQISEIFGPENLLCLIYFAGVFLSPMNEMQKIKWTIVILILNVLIPYAWTKFLSRQGVVIDDTLENKELHSCRVIALSPLFFVLVGETLLMAIKGQHQPLYAILISTIFLMISSGVISFFWKISAHAAGVSAFLTFCTILFGPYATLFIFLVPLVSWARIMLHRHNYAQLVAGSLVSPIVILATFKFLGII